MSSQAMSPLLKRLVDIRRDIHKNPELGFEEVRTTEIIASALKELDIDFRVPAGGTGVIADIKGPAGVPAVALRADIDALPLIEETGLEFASRAQGKMHACGHDGHTAILIGAATLLKQEKSLPAPIRLIFQPAEELGEGASYMIEQGALEDVGVIFGGHIDRHFRTGVIAVTDGIVNASADSFDIFITGKGGHAARPHEAVDAVVVGSLMVIALQTIVSREVNPAHPSVITVGLFQAGTASNVIAAECRLSGTIRAQDESVRSLLKSKVAHVAETIGQLHGAGITVKFTQALPVLSNTPEAVTIARQAAMKVVGEEQVHAMKIANMGGEDFSFYLQEVPGCYVRFGAQIDGKAYPAHSSSFVFDEECLLIGAKYFFEASRHAGSLLKANPRLTDGVAALNASGEVGDD